VVTTGANSAVRNAPRARTSRAFSRTAEPSDTAIDSGAPTTTKNKVLRSADQNSGVASSRR